MPGLSDIVDAVEKAKEANKWKYIEPDFSSSSQLLDRILNQYNKPTANSKDLNTQNNLVDEYDKIIAERTENNNRRIQDLIEYKNQLDQFKDIQDTIQRLNNYNNELDAVYRRQKLLQQQGDPYMTQNTDTVPYQPVSDLTEYQQKILAQARKNIVGAQYSQVLRNKDGYYDCSTFVSRTLKSSGIDIDPTTTTAGLHSALTKAGFTAFDYNPNNLQVGDILWQPGHTELYAGNNVIGAHSTKSGVSEYSMYNRNGTPKFKFTKVYRYGKYNLPNTLQQKASQTSAQIPANIQQSTVPTEIVQSPQPVQSTQSVAPTVPTQPITSLTDNYVQYISNESPTTPSLLRGIKPSVSKPIHTTQPDYSLGNLAYDTLNAMDTVNNTKSWADLFALGAKVVPKVIGRQYSSAALDVAKHFGKESAEETLIETSKNALNNAGYSPITKIHGPNSLIGITGLPSALANVLQKQSQYEKENGPINIFW